jgi:hypothetical protein
VRNGGRNVAMFEYTTWLVARDNRRRASKEVLLVVVVGIFGLFFGLDFF